MSAILKVAGLSMFGGTALGFLIAQAFLQFGGMGFVVVMAISGASIYIVGEIIERKGGKAQ